MAKLMCGADMCVNNVNGLCTANGIHVEGVTASSKLGTHCGTFLERNLKNAFMSLNNVNVGGEIRQVFTNSSIEMSPYIKCDALNCIHNVNRGCFAGNVTISGTGTLNSYGTVCEAFKEV